MDIHEGANLGVFDVDTAGYCELTMAQAGILVPFLMRNGATFEMHL